MTEIIQMSDRYIKQNLLGRGRAGEVHEAKDTVLDRVVAMRRFPDHQLQVEALSSEWKNSFMGLVAGLSRVSHPNLLRMFDGGIDDKGPFLVTSFLDGKSLSELAYGDEFGVVDAYELAEQVLDALQVAKDEGFYHYALSPTSIIAQPRHTRGYTYMLTDLGHSKLLPLIHGDEKALSMTQLPALLAPEVYEGHPKGVRTSQFILGQLIYWILAGGHPFAELTIYDAYTRHKSGSIECLSTYRPEVPKEFLNWLSVLLQPNPDDRFTTLVEAMQALPDPPKRFYAKKVKLPPKTICKEDVIASA